MRYICGLNVIILSCHFVFMFNMEDVCDMGEARIGVITENSAEIIRDYTKLCLDYLEILQGAILKSYQRKIIQHTTFDLNIINSR